MKHQKNNVAIVMKTAVQHRRRILLSVKSFFMIGVLVASNLGTSLVLVQTAAAKTLTADEYCAKYSTSLLRNACSDGINADEYCSDYALSPDTAASGVCTAAAKDRQNGQVTPGTVTPVEESGSGTSSGTDGSSDGSGSGSNSGSGSSLDQIQGLLDQTNSLTDYLDILHQAGPDSNVKTDEIPDNTKGEYINGAGKKQKIETIKEGTGNSPVILFFNGGGWHANDQTGQRVAKAEDNGINPGDHGYAMYDVTYRLGSSGVYYMFEDLMRGVKHMRDNAKLYGIDPEKIVIWGDSAGGSLSMRVAASGKSGAKAAVGWSAPTNAYTALFHSMASLAIGIDHSTCAPTDIAGLANFTNLLSGGSGDVAEYGQGLSSNDFSALGINLGAPTPFSGSLDPLTLLSQGLIAGKNLLGAAKDSEAITNKITNGQGLSSLGASTFNMAGKKFNECLDNFNALSPALFASPDTPPSFIAGFENDGVVANDQAYAMRDKLRQLGIKSEAKMLPGSPDCVQKTPDIFGTGCHLGYYSAFVCPTLAFIDSIIQPERGYTDCATGVSDNQGSADTPGSAASGGSSGSTGNSTGSGSDGTNSQGGNQPQGSKGTTTKKAGDSCTTSDGQAGTLKDPSGAHGLYCAPVDNTKVCDTWDSRCNGNNSLPGSSPTKVDYGCPAGQKYVSGIGNCQSSCPVGYADKIDHCIRIVNAG